MLPHMLQHMRMGVSHIPKESMPSRARMTSDVGEREHGGGMRAEEAITCASTYASAFSLPLHRSGLHAQAAPATPALHGVRQRELAPGSPDARTHPPLLLAHSHLLRTDIDVSEAHIRRILLVPRYRVSYTETPPSAPAATNQYSLRL
ncbi:hypothetical protein EVG20_g8205 [Dentipellis fragilis]|uniref:Uncharacterized protein n=1 Tax=Dentipellis fragilis TaxID=205917 RepID=A0A4Y9Y6Z6_9AGAM|nr:hypothetical protein EVG20_g8205 [Dentipellis fragilis]